MDIIFKVPHSDRLRCLFQLAGCPQPGFGTQLKLEKNLLCWGGGGVAGPGFRKLLSSLIPMHLILDTKVLFKASTCTCYNYFFEFSRNVFGWVDFQSQSPCQCTACCAVLFQASGGIRRTRYLIKRTYSHI